MAETIHPQGLDKDARRPILEKAKAGNWTAVDSRLAAVTNPEVLAKFRTFVDQNWSSAIDMPKLKILLERIDTRARAMGIVNKAASQPVTPPSAPVARGPAQAAAPRQDVAPAPRPAAPPPPSSAARPSQAPASRPSAPPPAPSRPAAAPIAAAAPAPRGPAPAAAPRQDVHHSAPTRSREGR